MQITREDEAINKIKDYAKRIMAIDIEIKRLQEDKKEIRNEFKADGVAVGKVTKVLNKLKRDLKQSEADRTEEELLYDMLEADEGIQNTVAELNN